MSLCSDRANNQKQDISDACTETLLPLLACEKRNLEYFRAQKHIDSELLPS